MVSDVELGSHAHSYTARAQSSGAEPVVVWDRRVSLSIHDNRQFQQRQCKEGSVRSSCGEQIPCAGYLPHYVTTLGGVHSRLLSRSSGQNEREWGGNYQALYTRYYADAFDDKAGK